MNIDIVDRCQCGMGAGPECFFAGHGQRPAGVVDPLHGGSCGDTVFIPLGHPHHLPAGSGLCLRPGLRSGRAGGQRQWQLHCFLWPLNAAGADSLSLLLLVVVYGGVFTCWNLNLYGFYLSFITCTTTFRTAY